MAENEEIRFILDNGTEIAIDGMASWVEDRANIIPAHKRERGAPANDMITPEPKVLRISGVLVSVINSNFIPQFQLLSSILNDNELPTLDTEYKDRGAAVMAAADNGNLITVVTDEERWEEMVISRITHQKEAKYSFRFTAELVEFSTFDTGTAIVPEVQLGKSADQVYGKDAKKTKARWNKGGSSGRVTPKSATPAQKTKVSAILGAFG